jgi:hypothetical protein
MGLHCTPLINNTINFTINVSVEAIIELKIISVKRKKFCNLEEYTIIIILVKTTKTLPEKKDLWKIKVN